ncbi:PREDICTED: sorting nexin 2B-like [Nicotiana attenuata]|uniref:Sorting nexin 2b n=1 Tax=Nicotiana attenuata TaxID=49451 RepID=A0A1J6KW36_NICAT|nr:PREDICTED: sorting nexin 2B-like [Nicotiana attenuata]OIT26955.1 sorting nexin 2b [Nicotiana attenuata]
MMGYENQSYEESHLYASKEEMESLVLNDDSSNGAHSFSDPLSSSSLPFAEIPAEQSQTPNSFNSILEPPSYAEAIFRSFDADHSPTEINGHDHSIASPSSSPSSSSEFLRISVSDPLKEQELTNSLVPGGSNYVTYLITTRTNLPEFDGTEFSVRRRFRDVVTLSDRLAESYRGFFIPLRPDKSVVESQVMQKQEFLEQRRAALEKYLRRLAAHPVIRRSEELRMFLEANGKLPLVRTTDVASRMLDGAVKLPKQMFGAETVVGGMVDVNEVAQPAKGGRDLLRIFKELKQSVTYDWGGVKPPLVEEDKELLEKKEKLQDFEQQLSNVSQQAEALVKAQQDIGETMGQMGLAFVKLTKFETEQAVYDSQRTRAADMKNVATAAVKSSRLYRELNAQTVKHLDKLHEYLGVMLAVNNAFSDRSSALLTVQTLLSELSSLNSRIEKLEAASSKIFGGDRSRIRKIEELKETLRVTEDAKSSAVREYEQIKENNKNELERFEKERHDDFLGMLRGFIVNQAGYAEKMANVWETVAEETSGYAKHGS